MDMDEFDADAFTGNVDHLTATEEGGIEMHFKNGRIKAWQNR